MRTSLAFAIALIAASSAFAQKEFGFDNRKASGQPYLKPEETVAKFKVADEFEVKLFAGEPQVVNPIAFTIDEKGRVWVVECFEYPKRTPKGKMPRDRIVILEDTDGDGVVRQADRVRRGQGLPGAGGAEEGRARRVRPGAAASRSATAACSSAPPPYLCFIENKNDKPGKFEVLLKGFGSQDTHETLNTFQWGPDGWLYGLHGVFTQSDVKPAQADGPDDADERRASGATTRRRRSSRSSPRARRTRGAWTGATPTGSSSSRCCVIPHLFHIVPGGIYKRQAGASFNPYAYGYLNEICDHTFHKESGWAHAGLISLDVPHMPEEYRNSVIFGSIHGCSIKQNILKPNGSTFTASRGDDFLVSRRQELPPDQPAVGPDRRHLPASTGTTRTRATRRSPDDWDYERGRVYRIQLKGTKTKKAEDLGKLTVAELKPLLNSLEPVSATNGPADHPGGEPADREAEAWSGPGNGFEAFAISARVE